MKYRCKWCHKEIEIPQSERAKTGLKMLEDHETECFKELHPEFGGYLMFVNSSQYAPSKSECKDFVKLMGALKRSQ